MPVLRLSDKMSSRRFLLLIVATSLIVLALVSMLALTGADRSSSRGARLETVASQGSVPGTTGPMVVGANGVPSSYEDKQEFLRQETLAQGGPATLKLLDHWMDVDPIVHTRCHNLAHIIGRTAALSTPASELIPLAPPARCDGGFMHGVLQTWAQQADDIEITTIGSLCKLAQKGAFEDCIHGAGHMLTVHYPNDITKGLSICVQTFKEDYPLQRCTGGVAMEYALNMLAQNKPGKYPVIQTMGPNGLVVVSMTKEQIADPCASVVGKMKDELLFECYSQVAPMWIATDASNTPDPVAYAERCAGLREIGRSSCEFSVGAWLIDITRIIDDASDEEVVAEVNRICASVLVEMRSKCVEGAVERAGQPRDLVASRVWCDSFTDEMLTGCVDGLAAAKRAQDRTFGVLPDTGSTTTTTN